MRIENRLKERRRQRKEALDYSRVLKMSIVITMKVAEVAGGSDTFFADIWRQLGRLIKDSIFSFLPLSSSQG